MVARDNDAKIIIVSHRLPISVSRDNEGEYAFSPSPGGLPAGLKEVHAQENAVWIGHPGLVCDAQSDADFKRLAVLLKKRKLVPVYIPAEIHDPFSKGMANGIIWPLLHYFFETMAFSFKDWEAYVKANRIFAQAVLDIVKPGDRVWIHDYQLMLLPRFLRDSGKPLNIAYFHHIPFPSPDVFRILPVRDEVIDGLLGADLIGFHTFDYVRNFISSAAHNVNTEVFVDYLRYRQRHVKISAFPLGIDVKEMDLALEKLHAEGSKQDLLADVEGKFVFLGVDRLDYTKGIPSRLKAYQMFLEDHPELVGRAIFIQVCVPSRVDIQKYGDIREKIEGLVGNISGLFGRPGYVPVHYVYRNFNFEDLVALYDRADVMVVTPLRDGLNLVCKEYVAAKRQNAGVLILSEFAGAAAEMGEAIIVNPYNIREVAHAMHRSLLMPEKEKMDRLKALRSRVIGFDNIAWARSFIESWSEVALPDARSSVLDKSIQKEVFKKFKIARKTFIFSDYDGTIAPLPNRSAYALLAPNLLDILDKLGVQAGCDITIVSGRSRLGLEHVLEHSNFNLSAEHGLFVKLHDGEWLRQLELQAEFDKVKPSIESLLGLYCRAISGSYIEEKEYSLVWHFQRAKDASLADSQAQVLRELLKQHLADTPYAPYGGKKVIDIHPVLVNKGMAVEWLLEKRGFDPQQDLLITMGDDVTDEDMYAVQKELNISIHVGQQNMRSRYHVGSQIELGKFLEAFLKEATGTHELKTG